LKEQKPDQNVETFASSEKLISTSNTESDLYITSILISILVVAIIAVIIVGTLRSKSLKVCQDLKAFKCCRDLNASKFSQCFHNMTKAVFGNEYQKIGSFTENNKEQTKSLKTSGPEIKPLVIKDQEMTPKSSGEQKRTKIVEEGPKLLELLSDNQQNELKANVISSANKPKESNINKSCLININNRENKRSNVVFDISNANSPKSSLKSVSYF